MVVSLLQKMMVPTMMGVFRMSQNHVRAGYKTGGCPPSAPTSSRNFRRPNLEPSSRSKPRHDFAVQHHLHMLFVSQRRTADITERLALACAKHWNFAHHRMGRPGKHVRRD